jgi:uncharacterized membrane protein HdeD (DUF308 family)
MDRRRDLLGVLWWTLLIKGIAAIIFGIAAVLWPAPTLVAIVYFFIAYILASGIMNMIFALSGRGHNNMWLYVLILGILEIGAGIWLARNTLISVGAFILFTGFVFLIRGLLQIVGAFMERTPDGASKVLLALAGALSMIVGAIIILQPISGGLAFVWALGLYALLVGAMDIARAIAARTQLEALPA